MQRESTLGRALWIAIVVLLLGYVVADFVRSPFLAPSGSAAVRPANLTLWTASAESGGETGTVLRDAAAALELGGHSTVVKSLSGGSAQAVIEFFSQTPSSRGADLLVITSSTLADLAHDRRDRLVPGASEQAALAREMLRRAQPVGLLESDPLALAVSSNSPIQSGPELTDSMYSKPWEQLVAIADDTWSRVELAALVNRAGVNGHIRFSVFQSGAEAGQAIEIGAANSVVATRGAIHDDVARGLLRELDWPFSDGRAPRAWVALVARPDQANATLLRLRSWVAELRRDRHWRAQLSRAGRFAGGPETERLLELLHSPAKADRLERLAQRVERR